MMIVPSLTPVRILMNISYCAFVKLKVQWFRFVVRLPVQRFSTASTTCCIVGVEVPKNAVAPEMPATLMVPARHRSSFFWTSPPVPSNCVIARLNFKAVNCAMTMWLRGVELPTLKIASTFATVRSSDVLLTRSLL